MQKTVEATQRSFNTIPPVALTRLYLTEWWNTTVPLHLSRPTLASRFQYDLGSSRMIVYLEPNRKAISLSDVGLTPTTTV